MMLWLILGLIVFHGLHSLRMVAPGWRDARLAAMGEARWKGIYSLVSLFGFVLLIWGYAMARPDAEILYVPPVWGRHLAMLLMAFSFALVPFNMRSSRLAPFIKNPFLVAIILWSIAHLLANGDTASVLLFGSFLVWALVNRHFVSRRDAQLPPVAPLYQDAIAFAGGLVLWLLFVWKAHEWLFGVSPIA